MKTYLILLGLCIALGLSACTKPEDLKHEAEAQYLDEKTDTLKDYKECVKNSAGEDAKMKQCEALLKAVEAVEG